MSHSGSRKVIFAALAGNSLIAITKLGAAAATGSSAMLSEGIHSVVDTLDHAIKKGLAAGQEGVRGSRIRGRSSIVIPASKA